MFNIFILFNVIEQEYYIEHTSKATGRVAAADCFVVKAVNNVRGKPQTSLTAKTTSA